MFLAGLSPRARAGFAALAHELVHSDGRLAAEEQLILDRLRAEAGDYDHDAMPLGPVEAAATIDDPDRRRAAFLELVGISWCDGEIADAEAVVLDRIADAWSIAPDERVATIDWVKRQTVLLDDARAIIAAER